MPLDDWWHTPRKPRYEASGNEKLAAEVERSVDGQACAVPAEVLDLSRDGFQLRLPVALTIGEHVCLRLHVEDAGLTLTLPGTVRWQRAADEQWLVGCLCDQPVAWESLGELFLNEVLVPDRP